MKPKPCVSEIQSWASHVLNGPERQRDNRRQVKIQHTEIHTECAFEALQSLNKHELCCDSDLGFFLSLTLHSGTNHHNPSAENGSECSQMSRTFGEVKFIVLRRRRQVWERWKQRYWFYSILPILPLSPRRMDLLNSDRETCRQRQRQRERDSGKGGYFSCWQHRQWKHQADKDIASSFPVYVSASACLSQMLACIHGY